MKILYKFFKELQFNKHCFYILAISCLANFQLSACECLMPNIHSAFKAASSVFLGTVIKSNFNNKVLSKENETIEFLVEKSWKGINGLRTQVIQGTSQCSFQFKSGEKYLVFKNQINTNFIHICSRTQLASDAKKDIRQLNNSIHIHNK